MKKTRYSESQIIKVLKEVEEEHRRLKQMYADLSLDHKVLKDIVDDFSREALAIEIDVGLSAEWVTRVLDRVVAWRGYPSKLRMDNGPEFISTILADWAEDHTVELEFIQPGKPTQNAYIERFNRTYRDEVLNMYVFNTLSEVRAITEEWMDQYNEERPHDALGDLTPFGYRWAHQA